MRGEAEVAHDRAERVARARERAELREGHHEHVPPPRAPGGAPRRSKVVRTELTAVM